MVGYIYQDSNTKCSEDESKKYRTNDPVGKGEQYDSMAY